MRLKKKKYIVTAVLLMIGSIFFVAAVARGAPLISPPDAAGGPVRINLKHFDHLFTPIKIGARKMAVVNIYSEFPDYNAVAAPNEGFACVDDAARAIVMLADYHRRHPGDKILSKIKLLVEFVLYMQNDNGYFNNFIRSDLSVNTSYKTSVAEMNWWSLRALWSLEVAYQLVHSDEGLARRITKATDRLVAVVTRDIPVTDFKTKASDGVEIPTWLPGGSGADQAALAIIALLPHYHRKGDVRVLILINALAKGVMQMQKGDKNHYPYGLFLSWKNRWHGWGNSQAYALLLAGQQLGHPEYIRSALREIDNFYPYLIKRGYAGSFALKSKAGHYTGFDDRRFPQIAYGVRPMIYAVSAAYDITANKKYIRQLARLRSWFSGNNRAGKIMYDQDSGRTYDGIISAEKINMNSGAESTIEGLMALQKWRQVK